MFYNIRFKRGTVYRVLINVQSLRKISVTDMEMAVLCYICKKYYAIF